VGEVGDGSGEAVLKSQAAFVVNPGTDVMTLKYCRRNGVFAQTSASFSQKFD
jgi:hypothetical protein